MKEQPVALGENLPALLDLFLSSFLELEEVDTLQSASADCKRREIIIACVACVYMCGFYV